MSLDHPAFELASLLEQALSLVRQESRKALGFAHQAVTLAEQVGTPQDRGGALRVRAMAHGSCGEIEAARADFLAGLELARLHSDPRLEAQCVTGLANAYFHSGEPAKAIHYGREAVELWRSLGEPLGLQGSLNNLAAFLGAQGHHGETIALLAEALSVAREHADRAQEAMILNNIALVHLEYGHATEALQHLEESLMLLDQDPDPIGRANTLINYARVLHLHQRDAEATLAAEQALQLAQQEDNPLYIAKAQITLATTLRDLAQARVALEHGACLAQSGSAPEPRLLAARAHANLALRENQPQAALPWLQEALLLAQQGHRFYVCAELHQELSLAHEALGDLAQALAHSREHHRLYAQLHQESAQQRLASERARLEVDLLRQQALEDPLTELYNRRYLDQFLESELARSQRQELPLSLILIDLDNFKQVNDQFSHRVGDQVLRVFAQLLREHTRRSDVLVRQAGDEFVVVAPETPVAVAQQVAERIRSAIQAHSWQELTPGFALTVSIGIADIRNGTDLLDHADNRLYDAKRGGKNRLAA